jgi:hypothetical protein
LDDTTTASVLAASKCTVGVFCMKWPSGAEGSRSESLLGSSADKPDGQTRRVYRNTPDAVSLHQIILLDHIVV